MIKYLKLSIYSLLILITSTAAIGATKDVTLKQYTTVNLKLMPDLHTKLTFPFALDDPILEPALKYNITPSDIFTVTSKRNNKGQNSLEVAYPFNAKHDLENAYQGQLSISVNGYNITVNLESTILPEKHLTMVKFNQKADDRKELVGQEVERLRQGMQLEFDTKLQEAIDYNASQYNLNNLARFFNTTPDITKINQEIENKTNRDLILFVNEIQKFNNEFTMFKFSLNNYSNKNLVNLEYKLGVVRNKKASALKGDFNCAANIKKSSVIDCVFITQNKKLELTKKDRFQLNVVSAGTTSSFYWY